MSSTANVETYLKVPSQIKYNQDITNNCTVVDGFCLSNSATKGLYVCVDGDNTKCMNIGVGINSSFEATPNLSLQSSSGTDFYEFKP
jgi:hypothetical protein